MSRTQHVTIFASFVVMSSIGTVVLYGFWQARGDEFVGLTRAGVFVIAMGLLHALAAWVYERQSALQTLLAKNSTGPAFDIRCPALFDPAAGYRNCVPAAMCQQLSILIFSAFMLDYGQMFRAALAAALTQLAMIALVILRRRSSPTRLDIAIIRYSAVPLFLFAGALQGYYFALLR